MRGWVGKVHLRSGEHGFQHHWPQTAERRTAWEVWGGRAAGGWGVGGLRGGCGGGGIEGRAGEEDGVHRDPLNKPRVP
jgi:hypothetical protein